MMNFYWILCSVFVALSCYKIVTQLDKISKTMEIIALHETCRTMMAVKDEGNTDENTDEFIRKFTKMVTKNTGVIILNEDDE